MLKNITASIVLYKTPPNIVKRVLDCLAIDNVFLRIYLIDNSPSSFTFPLDAYENVEYIHAPSNRGYGAGHNIALKMVSHYSDYHFILNPDIYFERGVIPRMILRMSSSSDLGLIMPKVIYPNGEIQYLCKLLPTPKTLFFRRFMPQCMSDNDYELRFTGYEKEMNVPSLSGCFMMVRMSAMKEIGFFDERFFMYAEDIDLSRRLYVISGNLYYPEVSVMHDFAKASYKSARMLFFHISSVVKYFNKWGWLVDKQRDEINNLTLLHLKRLNPLD